MILYSSKFNGLSKLNHTFRGNFAFTLIELLVVIAIIGILSALIIVGMNSTTQKATIAKAQVFSNSLRNSLMNDLISEWKFDGNANDSWSGGNNGTWYGAGGGTNLVANYRPTAECVSGQCLSFDGTDDYVNCGLGTNLSITGALTISAWIKTSSLATQRVVSKLHNTGGWNGYSLYITSGGVTLQVFNGGSGNSTGVSYSFPLNTFFNVTYIYDGTNKKLYINGVYIGQAAAGVTSIGITDTAFYIGRLLYYDPPTEHFSGSMDDIRIFDAAMPTSQIQQNYFAGINKLLAKKQITQSDYQQRLVELSNNYAKK